jgi:formate hydrogenlyase subunit 6/NADH:ubiquinone oxidoreductase subunit I
MPGVNDVTRKAPQNHVYSATCFSPLWYRQLAGCHACNACNVACPVDFENGMHFLTNYSMDIQNHLESELYKDKHYMLFH